MFSDVLLTVDYDRTLTGPDSKIPERNLEAIRYFTQNGGAFTVNTGRSMNTYGSKIDKVPTNAPLLLYNGSAAYHNGEFVYYHTIDLPMWEVLGKVAAEFPRMNLEVQALDHHYLLDAPPEYLDFYRGMGWNYKLAKPGDDLGPFVKFALFGTPRTSRVATMYDCSAEELAEFDRAEARILELWGDKVVTFRAAPRIIDVHAKGVSKGVAAVDLKNRLGKKVLVCVGDAENDIAMMEAADFAFCPADGGIADRYPNLCNCADGAIAEVIYKKIPEILANLP